MDLNNKEFIFNKNTSEDNLDVLVLGDLCMRNVPSKLVLQNNYLDIFSEIDDILRDKDLSIVNLENPLSNRGEPIYKTGPNIRVNPENVKLLKKGYFDVATLANNHMGDYGKEAIEDTINTLDENSILHLGAGMNIKEASLPLIINKKNRKIAILNYAENETGIAKIDKAGVCPIDIINVTNDIKKAKDKNDIVLVFIHGGNEFYPFPRPKIVRWYRHFIDTGASLVVGTHPHCPQGIEKYNGKPIIYSLGNFLFHNTNSKRGAKDSMWWRSHMVKLSFDQNSVCSLNVIPYDFRPDASKIRLMKGEEKKHYLEYLNYISSVIYDDEELKKYWDAWSDMKGEGIGFHLEGLKDGIASSINKPEAIVYGALHIFSCESHADLMKNYLSRASDLKLRTLKEYENKIKKLQKGKLF